MHRTRRLVLPLLASVVFTVAGCASTTIDTSVSTTAADQATTTLPPVSTDVASDLNEMVGRVTGLGDLIADHEGDAKESLSRIDEIWASVGTTINDNDPTLYREMQHQIDLITTAVSRHRPADADKAQRNLLAVVTTYLGRHPG